MNSLLKGDGDMEENTLKAALTATDSGCMAVMHELITKKRDFVKNIFLRRLDSSLDMMRNSDKYIRGTKNIDIPVFSSHAYNVTTTMLKDGFKVELDNWNQHHATEFMYVGGFTDNTTDVLDEIMIGALMTVYRDIVCDIRCCSTESIKEIVKPTVTGVLHHDFTGVAYPTVFFILLDDVHDQIFKDWISTMDADKPEVNPILKSYEEAKNRNKMMLRLESKDALKLIRYTISRLTKVGIIYGKNFDPVNNPPSRTKGMLAATRLRKMWPAFDTCSIEDIVNLLIGDSKDIILDVRPSISEKKGLRIYNDKKKFWLNRYPNNVFKKKVVLSGGEDNDMIVELLVLRK